MGLLLPISAHATTLDIISPTPQPNPLSFVEGSSASFLVATFSDSNPSLMASDFMASISWGDGTSSLGVITSNGVGFDVNASHTYADEGNFTPQISFSSDNGGLASALDSASVVDAILSNSLFAGVNAVEGSPFIAQIGSFQDANTLASTSDFMASIDWGDGTVSSGDVVPSGGGQFVINGNHTYAHDGTYTVSANASDFGGSSIQITGSATVSDAPIAGGGTSISTQAGVPFSGAVGTFTDSDSFGQPSDFSANIDWGDGTPESTGTVTGSLGSFQVLGGHTYALPGGYTISVAANDEGGSSTILNGSADVSGGSGGSASAPEPATWLGAAAALAMLLRWRRSASDFPHPDARGGRGRNAH